MTKYKEYVMRMFEVNRGLFDSFKKIHDKYVIDPNQWQQKLNEEGSKILSVVNDYENRLCSRSEGSGYGVYSGNLAEKFQQEVRKYYPKIDCIGILVFTIKKINLL